MASWVLYMLAVRQWLGRIPFYASLVPMTGIAVACLAPLALLLPPFKGGPSTGAVRRRTH